MLRFKLKELISKKEFVEGRRIPLGEVSAETGINRTTMSKLMHHRGYSTVTDNIDKLCTYFGCSVGDLVEYFPNDEIGSQ